MKYSLHTLQGSMSIRNGHGTASAKIGTLLSEVVGMGDEDWKCTVDGELLDAKVGDRWLHILKPMDGWVAVRHAGVDYCTIVENTPFEWPPFVTLETDTGERQVYDKRD